MASSPREWVRVKNFCPSTDMSEKMGIEAESKGSASVVQTRTVRRLLPALPPAANEQGDFSLARLGGEIREQTRGGAAMIRLEFFCQFAGHTNLAIGIERGDGGDSLGEPMRRLEENRSLPPGERFLKFAPFAARFHREEAAKVEGIGRQAGPGKGGDHSRRPGDHLNSYAGFVAGIDETIPRIRDRGSAGVGEKDDTFSVECPLDEGGRPMLLVMFVQGD